MSSIVQSKWREILRSSHAEPALGKPSPSLLFSFHYISVVKYSVVQYSIVYYDMSSILLLPRITLLYRITWTMAYTLVIYCTVLYPYCVYSLFRLVWPDVKCVTRVGAVCIFVCDFPQLAIT